jgi:HlyD family secretion protein
MKKLSIILFVTLFVISFVACSDKKDEKSNENNSNNNTTSKNTSTTQATNVAYEPDKVVATARIEPEAKIAKLSSEVSGLIKKVYVKTGDVVKKGDILIELSSELESQQVAQNQSFTQVKISSKAEIEANIYLEQTKLGNAKQKYERLKTAFGKGAETQQNLDNAELDYKSIQKNIEKLQKQILTNASEMAENQIKINIANIQLQRRFIKAPSNGIILSINLSEGNAVLAYSDLIEFAPESPINAVCEVDELFANDIKVGQIAYIRAVGRTEKLAEGTVILTSPYLKKKSLFSDASNDLDDRRVREVRIRLTNPKDLLFGMRVEGVIATKE